jgi:hypothetical protein
MLLPHQFFERNPGLPFKNVSIGFQPEIGSVASPTYTGLQQFMSDDEIESGFPTRYATKSRSEIWEYHKFLPWTTQLPNNTTYDHVYAYFDNDSVVAARDWVAAAQLAAHVQYQNLFGGFISHLFSHTTAVLMWKTQSPWPSLRGFLYDWYLERTGALRGVRAALAEPASCTFDSASSRLRLINRQVYPLQLSNESKIHVEYSWFDLQGSVVAVGSINVPGDDVPAMSSVILAGEEDHLAWPDQCAGVCFLRLKLVGTGISETPHAWYWLTNPAHGLAADYSPLGRLRLNQGAVAWLSIEACVYVNAQIVVNVTVAVPSSSRDVLFYPTISLYQEKSPLLPMFDSLETDVVLLPNTNQQRVVRAPLAALEISSIRVVLESWNGSPVEAATTCEEGAGSSSAQRS